MSIEATEAQAAIADQVQLSLSTAAARNLASTTKTEPQMQGITERWLLRKLPWVDVKGGTYRVNRRLAYQVGRGRVSFVQTGADVRVLPQSLAEVPALRGFDDVALLTELASRFTQREFRRGDVLVREGQPIGDVYLIAHGKIERTSSGKYGETTRLGVLADGDHMGDQALRDADGGWNYTATAATPGTLLALPFAVFQELLDRSPALQAQIERYLAESRQKMTKRGEAEIDLAAGHDGEPDMPVTFVDYELSPREYELSVAQTVLQVHTRVADLYNDPMDQLQQQLRLTVEALRERQDHELINNREFGLLHNVHNEQRIHTRSGPPTPDDMDELLTMRRGTKLFLAHPRAIAAFRQQCTLVGVYPDTVDVDGHPMTAWRGVPVLPSPKLPIVDGTSAILAMRLGEDDNGVVGLHQTGIPDEVEPSLNVRFMGINEKAMLQYLVSAYYSAAVLVPNALGVLENVEVTGPHV